jgi:DNA repair photolyase
MVTIEPRLRKGKVLTPSAIPCLRRLPTVNVTLGCAHGCGYCYIQGYANYPGDDRIVLYTNTAQLIRAELQSMRRKPTRVFFSPSSDAFQYQPQVRTVSLESMEVLLEAGVEVAFLTKGFLTAECYELFARHPGKVFAQIGITTIDTNLSRAIEPRAAPPRMRLEAIRRLIELGIVVRPRLDPLIPDITDTSSNLAGLFESFAAIGIHAASASFLFTRNPLVGKIKTHYAELGQGFGPSRWKHQSFAESCGSAKSLDESDRRRRFGNVRAIANRHGIDIDICTCKNPELEGPGCSIAASQRNARDAGEPGTLF